MTVRLADSQKRLRVALVLVCVFVSLVAGRLVQLQGVDASRYELMATNTNLTTVSLPAQRGPMVDRNGNVLVQSVDAYDVVVDQVVVGRDGNAAAYALQLEDILDQDAAAIQRTLTGDKRYQYLAKRVSPREWLAISELGLGGIFAEPVSERIYPTGAVGGNIVGFVGADGSGLAGLEQSIDGQLAGVDGSLTFQATGSNTRIPLGAGSRDEPEAGVGLRLTIDRDLQWYAEQAIAQAVVRSKAAGGNVVVQDIRTGEILAMATAPVVNPSRPGKTEAQHRGNRVVEEVYEPGSVFKPITMSVVVEEGMAGPATVFSVPDRVSRHGETIRDYYNHPEEPMTLTDIMAISSNVGTVLAADLVDAQTYGDYLLQFGLGDTSGLGFPAEGRGALPGEWRAINRDYAAFGQSISLTTVQLASAYSTIANGGVRMAPTVVAATIEPDGTEARVSREAPERVISEASASAVTSMMEAVMGPDGTGRNSSIDGYRVAGKTGTAQRVDPACGCYRDYNASFAGFAPADEPRFSVAVSLLDPKNGNSGGALAGPVFADVMEFALHRYGVAPSDDGEDEQSEL